MTTRVLVTYASTYGATAEIAEAIADVLARAGLETDLLPVERVEDVTRYGVVVLGSAVYLGRWRREAVRFLEGQAIALARRPLWVYVSGPSGKDDLADPSGSWQLSTRLHTLLDRIRVRDLTIFHGTFGRGSFRGIERWIVRTVRSPGSDFRDWGAVTAWATDIAADIVDVPERSLLDRSS